MWLGNVSQTTRGNPEKRHVHSAGMTVSALKTLHAARESRGSKSEEQLLDWQPGTSTGGPADVS